MSKKKSRENISGKIRRLGRVRAALAVAAVLVVGVIAVISIRAMQPGNDQGEPTNDKGELYVDVTKPVAAIEMENGAVIRLELDPEIAPNTVRNFIHLAGQGFYDGLIFHRVIPGFMIQGGCPQGAGTGGPGYSIKGEFSDNGHENPLTHSRGVISMARSRLPNSAGSQFFITVDNAPHLDGQYAAFGTVIEGMEEVDRIVSVKRDANDKPLEEQRIKSVTVDKHGVEYDPPEKI